MKDATTVKALQAELAQSSAALADALARAERAEAEAAESAGRVVGLESDQRQYRPERELLQAITNKVLAAILVVDGRELRAKYANWACRRILDELGHTHVDIIGRTVEEVLPGAEPSGLVQLLRQVASTGQAVANPESEYTGFARGATYWRWSIVPLPLTPDTCPDLLLVANELTEQVVGRRKIEALAERLATGQRFLSSIMESVPACIVYLDENLVYRQCNQAAATELGKPVERIVGRPLRELHPNSPHVWEAAESVLRSGEAFSSEELPVHWPDRPEEGTQYYAVTYLPDKDAAGHVRGVIVEGHRVTPLVAARQRAEEVRDELEERVSERTAELTETIKALSFQASIVANVSDAVVATDADNRIALFNRAAEELYGAKAEEVLGRQPVQVFRSELAGVSREDVYRELYEQGRWRGEVVVYRRDGTAICADSIGVLLRDENGRLAGHIWVNRDITERKRAEEALRASREEIRAYSRRLVEAIENERRSLARELHDQAAQSLSALKFSLSRLRRELDSQGRQAARFDETGQLVDSVMDDLHRLALNLRPVSLDRYGLLPALQQYAEFYRRQSGLKVDLVSVGIEDERLPADVETALYRVVQEALTNVVRHARAKRVGVILERQGDRVVAIVEDDGQGFDVDEALRSGRLGLLGMRERAEMLSGRLTIESAPGTGTTVYADLPCAPGETALGA